MVFIQGVRLLGRIVQRFLPDWRAPSYSSGSICEILIDHLSRNLTYRELRVPLPFVLAGKQSLILITRSSLGGNQSSTTGALQALKTEDAERKRGTLQGRYALRLLL